MQEAAYTPVQPETAPSFGGIHQLASAPPSASVDRRGHVVDFAWCQFVCLALGYIYMFVEPFTL